MAATLQGRNLTQAHKHAQIELSAQAVADQVQIAGLLLDPFRLDATRLDWLAVAGLSAEQFFVLSSSLAEAYLVQYRAVESGTVGPIVRPTFDQAGALNSLDGVVAKTKQLTGVDPPGVAFTTALGARLGSVQRRVLAGGRGLIQASTAANHASVGWRRVTDGNPCAFCAMLAGRGPVYNTAESAHGFHNLCGCTVEEVFGDWVPSAQEERFRELYAASSGGSTGDVLASMRANGQGIINDATVPATQAGGGGARKPPKPQSASVSSSDRWRRPIKLTG